HGGRQTFLVIEEGYLDTREGYSVEDTEDGAEDFLVADDDTFWVYDDDIYTWFQRRFQGRKMRRGFKGRRKGKRKGGKGSGGRRFFKNRKGKSSLADAQTVEEPEDPPHGEESGTKNDEHMGDAEEANDDALATAGSRQGEESMPEIFCRKDDGDKLHDQGIWGKQKNVADPGRSRRRSRQPPCSAEEKNETAFDILEGAKEKEGSEDTAELQEF
ncbi:unnamed protein product, partial [Symbiodinium microadriaticum]